MDILRLVLQAIWLFLPAYIANGSAVVVGKIFSKYLKSFPIDFGKTLAGKPIFGKGKTYEGFIGGVLLGVLTGFIQSQFTIQGYIQMTLLLAFLLSFGALFGDLVKSFFKRRLGFERGKSWPVVDQLDFVIGGLLFAMIVTKIPLAYIIVLVIISPAIHLLANFIGWLLKIKKVWW